MAKVSVMKKTCPKCNMTKRLEEFRTNKKWKEEVCKDRWCKNCADLLVKDEKTLTEYFNENRRHVPNELWNTMHTRAYKDIEMNFPNSSKSKKESLILKKTKKYIFQVMNLNGMYKFMETNVIDEHGDQKPISKVQSEQVQTYNEKWNGYFTDKDIRYLEQYYEGLDKDFRLSNQSYRDYALKVCKASLAMDNAFSEMQRGVPNAQKKYKELKDIFDSLSQSAKFAEKSRSTNDVVGFGSLGELIAHIEQQGHLMTPVKFPEDDVDQIINDFRWIITTIGEKF